MAKQTFTTGQVLTAAQMTSLQATAMGGGAASTKTANYVLVAADAGTTVAMNAAGATTITVNTGLFAAGDTVFIQNIGAGVCTITAGTATVNTAGALALPQYDAGILYFTSASAAIFYDYIQVGAASPLTTKGDLYTFSTSDTRLAVGANGTVLTADSAEATGLKWATPAGGGKIAQVIFASTAAGTDIASITYTDTGLTATITPSAASSRIIIYAGQEWVAESGASSIKSSARLMRGATQIIDYGVVHSFDFPNTSGTRKNGSIKSLFYVDSPSTTSSTTYKVQGRINTTDDSRIIRCQNETYSTIILMEVLA